MSAQVESYSPAALTTFNEQLIEEFRTHGGTVSGRFSGVPLLLLSTTGAKSGLPRTTPLTYSRDFSRLIIVAAKQGAPTNPDWYHNVKANPVVTVEVGGERFQAVARVTEEAVMVEVGTETFPARATVAVGSERQRLFNRLVEVIPRTR